MVFVHARNDTVRTAMVLRDMAKNSKNDWSYFSPEQSRQYGEAEKSVSKKKYEVENVGTSSSKSHAGDDRFKMFAYCFIVKM